ncbi:hypothetical protein V1477_007261, partial [Vespula maculifrons]
ICSHSLGSTYVLQFGFKETSIYRKYYRPRSHHVEVAASGDPRANGDSTLQFANQTKSITVGLLIAPENTAPVPADIGTSVFLILPKRRREERVEKEAGTCAHVKTIEFGRKERKDNRKITHARVRTMKLKREDGHRMRPAQKPTPMSPTHETHPRETIIINLVYSFLNIQKI